MSVTKFGLFNITDGVVYKTVAGLSLKTSIMVPKKPFASDKRPVMVHWHGGGYMLGSRMFEPWFGAWLMQLAEQRGAIVVSPDYRLLPEATTDDMLDDVESFFTWLHSDLNKEVQKSTEGKLEVDLNSLAVFGESAGGYLSIQSGILCPNAGIKAIVSQYGSVDMDHPNFSAPGGVIFGEPAQPLAKANEFIAAYHAKHVDVPNPKVRLEASPGELWPLAVAYLNAGKLGDAVGKGPRANPIKGIEGVKSFPPIAFTHGKQDSVVPCDNTIDFAKKLGQLLPEVPMHVETPDGEHGFDGEVTLDAPWVKNIVAFLNKYWP
ncbi:hypothetical protein AAFC00_000230 [Neodothiora populina]|uniref:Alpha/beta hydrolase fold-3 domain-containing protein n=1 Tax=Neodothiora populina TaxID=2781224 RepID=A0ABR3P363_9PEZI